ncbi:MAG TPA: hypothetical protein PKO06_12935, partial [Candidatus Ozemobacteraceae bacterium]|nr:hypothetical protein [Candidatus Ozemobacteraceae bacterium]
ALPLIDIRLAQRDPAEIGGIYVPDRDHGVLSLLPPEWVKRACAEPCFVFLDELNAAVSKLHQAVAYQIVLEHRIGDFAFHPQTVVMAAGNLEEDRAIVSTLSSALNNRFAHFVLRVDAKTWTEWARQHQIDAMLISFIERNGEEALYENTGESAFASPRSWEMVSRVLKTVELNHRKRAVAACVGASMAELLFQQVKLFETFDAKAILVEGRPVNFRTKPFAEPSIAQAAVFAVADLACGKDGNAEPDHLPNVVKFLRSPGLDPEFIMLFLRRVKEKSNLYELLKTVPEFKVVAGDLVDIHGGYLKSMGAPLAAPFEAKCPF